MLRSLNIKYDLHEDYIIKTATEQGELIDAFNLLQEVYAEKGLTSSEMMIRTTAYHVLPTTTVVVIKKGEKVVGTGTHIADSALGLPLEKIFNIDKLRKTGGKISEISSLAICQEERNRHNGTSLFLHLSKYLQDFSRLVSQDDYLVIATHPVIRDYYKGLFGFMEISHEIKNYNFVDNSPAYGMYLPLGSSEFLEDFKKHFKGRPDHQNIYKFFIETVSTGHLHVANQFYHPQHVFSAKDMDTVFNVLSDTLKKLNIKEIACIRNQYMLDSYDNVLAFPDKTADFSLSRVEARYFLWLYGKIQDGGSGDVRIPNISQGGLQIVFQDGVIGSGDILSLDVTVSKTIRIHMRVEIVWRQGNRLGAKIIEMSDNDAKIWHDLVSSLETRFASVA